MAHFAQIDEQNIVTQVIVISNDDMLDENGQEKESLGIQVCRAICGTETNWVQTSYNNNFRKRYAVIGDVYDADSDVFYSPVGPFPSWALDENFDWQPPTPMPTDGKPYDWDEELLEWVEVVEEAGE